MAYRLWRNKVQRGIKAAKYHYYYNKLAKLEQINPAKWWREIKKLTGQDIQLEEHHQFLLSDIKSLANKINDFFCEPHESFSPLHPASRSPASNCSARTSRV